MLISDSLTYDTLPYVNKFYAYHAYLLGVQARNNKDLTMLKLAQEKMKKYEGDYIKTNIDYPNRVEQFKKLLNIKIL